ncbi:FAS1 domain-containing protein [Ascobolus immersus RN42]|uniref:FAS1 domain-containing protein n=1 Tax=Ascobolus immersus RN42 TaxID=1160509 RepID=A0A3N4HN53_ASCIM|nr:FAS1 domain-containing protein [Ascobolus immersus RN42]
MIKDQVDELLSSTKKGEEKAVSWDLDEITSLDQLRRWDVNAWLTPESENEDDLEAWHHHHHHHGPDHKHNHDHDHKHHHLPGHDEDGPPEGAIQPEATLLDMLRQTHHSSHFLDFLSDFPEIEKRLDDHSHNLTVFVPSNDAFDRILKGKKKEDLKLPKEDIEKLLKYHIMDGYHDYDGLKWHNTIASEMEDHELGQDEKQRLRIGLYRCPTVNLYSEILIKDYIGKNGVIHAVDSIILPPPSISTILNLLPSHFSTTLLALHKTGLIDQLSAHDGSNKYTIFAPSNSAWNHIPMKITAFLFSEHGKEYLEAVMKYHIVENRVIYSDGMIGDRQDPGGIETHFPAGYHHLTAHSLLTHKNKDEGRDESGALNIDITRFPSMLSFRVNGHSDIMIANGVARDGVIHIPNHILMPPCQDLPDHGHHDESADAPHRDLKKRWSLFGWGRGEEKKVEKEVETKSCVDMSMVIEDSEEGLEAWKRSWERYL